MEVEVFEFEGMALTFDTNWVESVETRLSEDGKGGDLLLSMKEGRFPAWVKKEASDG